MKKVYEERTVKLEPQKSAPTNPFQTPAEGQKSEPKPEKKKEEPQGSSEKSKVDEAFGPVK